MKNISFTKNKQRHLLLDKKEPFQASDHCHYHYIIIIRRAITYVEQLEAAGETNINGALLMAMDILAEEQSNGTLKVSLENLKSSLSILR